MKNRILLVLIALMIIPFCAFAQEKNPSDIQYVDRLPQTYEFYSHQISVGYGFGSAAKYIAKYNGADIAGHFYGDDKYWGEINMRYVYRYSNLVTFGISYTYTGMRRDVTDSHGSVVGHSSVNINVIMPEFKSDWYQNGIFTIYSRAAVGVTIAKVTDEYKSLTKNNTTTVAKFAFQASPIGFEIGKAFAFYVEAGFGYQGIILAGLRYNF